MKVQSLNRRQVMSRSINKIILVGNVGRDPDVQTTTSGTKVAHVSLATSRRFPRDGGMEERTEWHRLTLWDRLAQLAEDYVRKGDRLYVEGRMEYDSFERNGVTIPTAEVQVRELVLLGTPSARTEDTELVETEIAV
jgi:single-strand DNA-binding protein